MPSFVAEASRRIPGTPEALFGRLADYGSWKAWMPSSFRPAGEPSGLLSMGRELRVHIQGMPGVAKIQVSAFQTPREIAWTGGRRGLLAAEHRFVFDGDGQGGTMVRSIETWSGALAPLLRRFVKPRAERIGEQQLEGLARSLSA